MTIKRRIIAALAAAITTVGIIAAAVPAATEDSGNIPEKVRRDAYVSESKILYGSKYAELALEIKYDMPIYVIDGSTYVPLRESAEILELNVDWNAETKTISLLPSEYDDASVMEKASKLLGIELPEPPDFPYFDAWGDLALDGFLIKYGIEKDDYLALCEALDKQEKFIKFDKKLYSEDEQYKTWWYDSCDSWLEYRYDTYRWWNIKSCLDSEVSYISFIRSTKNGVTSNYYAFVNVTIEDGEYMLYIYYCG